MQKKKLSIIALSVSEVDVAEPFDNVMEWLELMDFRVQLMDHNFFESHHVKARFLIKDLFGRSDLGDHLVAGDLICNLQSRHLEDLKRL